MTTAEYGIQPFGSIDGAFTWRFSKLEDAKAQAMKLAQEHHVDVLVFQIVGTYRPAESVTDLPVLNMKPIGLSKFPPSTYTRTRSQE